MIYLSIGSVFFASLLIITTFVIPGGVKIQDFLMWMKDAYPRLADPILNSANAFTWNRAGNWAPAGAAAQYIALLGGSFAQRQIVSTIISGTIVLLFSAATFFLCRRKNISPTDMLLFWSLATLLSPKLTHTWYFIWVIPLLVIFIANWFQRRYESTYQLLLAVLVVLVGLLSLDIPLISLVSAFSLSFLVYWYCFQRSQIDILATVIV